eukprot:gene891-9802_t
MEQQSSPKKKSNDDTGCLLPVSAKLLREADVNNGTISIEGNELEAHTLVSLMGKVTSIKSSQELEFDIDDCTGKITIKDYANIKCPLQIGMTVKVTGSFVSSHSGTFINCYSIKIVTNYNEITHHHLKIVKAHILRTRGTGKCFKPKEVIRDDLMVDDDNDELDDSNPLSALQRDIIHLLEIKEQVALDEIQSSYGSKYSGENINSAIFTLYEMKKIYSPKDNVFKIIVD